MIIPLFQRNGVNSVLPLQQDNARAHAARLIHLTRNHLRVHSINVMDWLGISTDMNCIKHMWDELERRLRRRPVQRRNVRELAFALQQECQNIPIATVRRLIKSMSRHLRKVIRNNGGHNQN